MKVDETIDKITTFLTLQGKRPKMLVPFLWGKPGSGKSDITLQVAKNMNYHHIDVRLTHYDESVVAGYPVVEEAGEFKQLNFALPPWVLEAEKHTEGALVTFDEFNRAIPAQRNSVLQVLCERQLGSYRFPPYVKFIACGNLGEEDGTDVESMDSATSNRFAHFKWEPTKTDWLKWAKGKVNQCIIDFVKVKENSLYSEPKEDQAFLTPRSLTALSDIMNERMVDKTSYNEAGKIVSQFGMECIGAIYRKILTFFDTARLITLKDVITNFNKVENDIKNAHENTMSEILNDATPEKFFEFKESEIKNFSKFLKYIRVDELSGYIVNLITHAKISNAPTLNLKLIRKDHEKVFSSIFENMTELEVV